MTYRILPILLFLSTLTYAQTLPDSPKPKLSVIAANSVNIGSTMFMANAVRSGAHDCIIEAHRYTPPLAYQPSPRGKYAHTLAVQLPIDAAIAITTWKLRASHPHLATWLPIAASSFKFGVGMSQYNSGCS